jgi:hypothetical protein
MMQPNHNAQVFSKIKNMTKITSTFSSGNNIHYSPHVDEFGNPVERTKFDYPYSYDGFVTYRNGENSEANSTIYSDRIHHGEKYITLCQKHFGNQGQMFFDRKPEQIQAFLRDWCEDQELKLVFVMEYCNVSSGYPLWRFDFKTTK